MAVIGGFRSDLSITHKTDGNFGNVSTGVLFSKVENFSPGGNFNPANRGEILLRLHDELQPLLKY